VLSERERDRAAVRTPTFRFRVNLILAKIREQQCFRRKLAFGFAIGVERENSSLLANLHRLADRFAKKSPSPHKTIPYKNSPYKSTAEGKISFGGCNYLIVITFSE